MEDAAVELVQRISAVPTILRVITQLTGLRLSLVAHVTEAAWRCCAVNDQLQFGLEVGGTLDVATTLCSEVREARAPIVISHASRDPQYAAHRTPKQYAFESYIAVPIFLADGSYFGNVCALDSQPRDLSGSQTLAVFELFAQLIAMQLEAEASREATARQLLGATRDGELREQFIAVLGHDLRTPLASIAMGAEALAVEVQAPGALAVVQRIGRSAARIGKLVDDVLDFARGRLGSGIPLTPTDIADVGAVFREVVDDLRVVHSNRTIEYRADGTGAVVGDPTRLAQLIQNLLSNALTHSPPDAHVRVTVQLTDAQLVLAVANGGPALPAVLLARMFEPYYRGSTKGGLGLGLYIAAQIVRSHHGTIEARSNGGWTTVTCTLPRSGPPGAA